LPTPENEGSKQLSLKKIKLFLLTDDYPESNTKKQVKLPAFRQISDSAFGFLKITCRLFLGCIVYLAVAVENYLR
jgi:hypothetical protein